VQLRQPAHRRVEIAGEGDGVEGGAERLGLLARPVKHVQLRRAELAKRVARGARRAARTEHERAELGRGRAAVPLPQPGGEQVADAHPVRVVGE